VEKCLICGCTEDAACDGGCWWSYVNICSNCASLYALLIGLVSVARGKNRVDDMAELLKKPRIRRRISEFLEGPSARRPRVQAPSPPSPSRGNGRSRRAAPPASSAAPT
jgi:hypothetical protein